MGRGSRSAPGWRVTPSRHPSRGKRARSAPIKSARAANPTALVMLRAGPPTQSMSKRASHLFSAFYGLAIQGTARHRDRHRLGLASCRPLASRSKP